MLKNGNVLFKHQKLIDIILFQKLKDFLIHRFSIFTRSVIMQSFSSTFLDVISPYFERCHNAVLLFQYYAHKVKLVFHNCHSQIFCSQLNTWNINNRFVFFFFPRDDKKRTFIFKKLPFLKPFWNWISTRSSSNLT